MTTRATIPNFAGDVLAPGTAEYDARRLLWNGAMDRRPAVIARCASAGDVAAAIRYARDCGLEIGVRCGGHGVLGLAVPDGGLMIDLGPMGEVTVDPIARRATVGGGALLRTLDRATEPHGLATTAGNVSHTGVGGLTLGGGRGWLARQFGLACDNVASYEVVTADGEVGRASATEHPDLYWGLRGGGGNFGVVTEFVFRLHPINHTALSAELWFDAADAVGPLRAWRDLLADAPREATLTADIITAPGLPFLPASLHGRSVAIIGFIWVGAVAAARAWVPRLQTIGTPAAEQVEELTYLSLQTSGDEFHVHGRRRYSAGHYLYELTDTAIDAFLTRGVAEGAPEPDWTRMAGGGFQAYGGAIAEVGDDESAFSHRRTLVEFFAGATWDDPTEDADRMAAARAWGATMAPFASGAYLNALSDQGDDVIRRIYHDSQLTRLGELKRAWDPDNVFHLNQNIRPAA